MPSPNSLFGRTYDPHVANMVKLAIIPEKILLSQCCLVHDKSYMDCPEIEIRAPGRNVGNEQPVPCTAILKLEFQSGTLKTLVVFVS